METLSNAKLETILSLTGNNKCFECDSPDVDWVSFPSTVFLCLNCCRRHKEFKVKPTLKSLSISEFTQHEIKKMNLGGNARFLTLMNEYKISLKEPNIEHKYQTVIALYYNKLLDVQVNKIENNPGADEEYNRILEERPSYEVGNKISQGLILNEGVKVEDIKNDSNEGKYKTDSSLGGWLGYFGDKINDVTEFIGLNAVINNASNGINNSMERFGIKDTLNKAVDYSKSAGEYVVDKAKEVSQSPLVIGTKEKITQVVNDVKDTTMNMINNTINVNPSNNDGNQEQNNGQL
jgi:hypothetical protein